ncbi:adenylate/guanylate cyclase domain-containing protein [Microvirga massiliensis]|uniref:adenylate/guanylate cyclase domain-containing protein n=1 Tax=Microvirga massiliensis TaxID=1033741 RepID=UPI0009E2CCBF|nr:adenylate/guanylate cyclase domain-containing protein [Microvirga massiliensis]
MSAPSAIATPADPSLSGVENSSPALPAGIDRLRNWLIEEGSRDDDADEMLTQFAEHLNDLGLPVDRIATAIEALHSEYAGVGRFWTRDEGSTIRLLPHGARREAVYQRSPFAHVNRTGEWLLLDLAETSDDLFPIVPDLKRAGYRHYLTVPVRFASGAGNGISFATRSPDGFGPQALHVLRAVIPTFAAVTELRALRKRLDNVLRIYVGDEPHRAILSGAIVRGQVTRIRSAILFADMRDYTKISAKLSPEGTVELLNSLFDCLVPPIEEEGGEVLKYLGDGLLAIFRDRGDDTGGAAQSALTAAIGALTRIVAANNEGRFPAPVRVGIALHHGEAAYGNVGSGQRLDFTVIGRDVNLASRMAELNRELGEPLLMSRGFVDHLWGNPERLGPYLLDGFEEPVEIYRP